MENSNSSFLLLFCFICTFIYFLASGRRGSKSVSPKLPPGPIPLPLVGNLLKLGNKPHEALTELAKAYGPIMTLKLGCLTTVIISSSSMAKEVLRKNDQALSARIIPDSVRACNHHQVSMVWSPPSPQWRNMRKICNTEIFSSQKLDAMQGLRCQKVEKLVAYVRDNSRAGRAVNIGQAAFVTSLNLLSNTFFSVDLVHLGSDSAQDFKELIWAVMEDGGRPNLADNFPILRWIDPQGVRRRLSSHFQRLLEIFDEMIDQRLQLRALLASPTHNDNSDVLDVLLNHTKDNASQFGRNELRHFILVGN
uniref:Geraniol 8-hydroxylase-like n=1 Tax=Nelumbo nucifera TaxID=4432 RepID=A0A822XEL2_NELNU|nr:TPA_asm: hypothetical protein HUJ06_020090 [Nelumbo nucifera]